MELKFAPFTSSINPGFWSAITKLKLDVLGLKEEGINVHAYYENKFQPSVPTLLTLDWNAFDPGKNNNKHLISRDLISRDLISRNSISRNTVGQKI